MEEWTKFDRLVAECHSWQLLVGVHEPGQPPRWRLQDPKKLDDNRRDVVMMTRAFVDGHKGYLNRLLDVCLVRFPGSNQGQIALAIGAAVAAMPNDEPASHVARDLPKLMRAIGDKIFKLGDWTSYLVALEFTGTTDFSKTKTEPTPDAKRSWVDELFDGLDEFRREAKEVWDEMEADARAAREEAKRDADEARAEAEELVRKAKARMNAEWPKFRDRINAWLADKPEPPKS